MNETKECCICGKHFEGFGNNPYPLVEDESTNLVCCDDCNTKVILARMERIYGERCPYCGGNITEDEKRIYRMCTTCWEDGAE